MQEETDYTWKKKKLLFTYHFNIYSHSGRIRRKIRLKFSKEQFPILCSKYQLLLHTQEVLRNIWKFSLSTDFVNGINSRLCRHRQVLCELKICISLLWSLNKVKNLRLNLLQCVSFHCRNVQSRSIISWTSKQSQGHLKWNEGQPNHGLNKLPSHKTLNDKNTCKEILKPLANFYVHRQTNSQQQCNHHHALC